MVLPSVGRFVAVYEVAEPVFTSTRSSEPEPVVPSLNAYPVAPDSVVHVKVCELPLKVEPGAGEVRVGAVREPPPPPPPPPLDAVTV